MSERINARLSQPLVGFVGQMVGEDGLYETPSEYVRDLTRRDMERREIPRRSRTVEAQALSRDSTRFLPKPVH